MRAYFSVFSLVSFVTGFSLLASCGTLNPPNFTQKDTPENADSTGTRPLVSVGISLAEESAKSGLHLVGRDLEISKFVVDLMGGASCWPQEMATTNFELTGGATLQVFKGAQNCSIKLKKFYISTKEYPHPMGLELKAGQAADFTHSPSGMAPQVYTIKVTKELDTTTGGSIELQGLDFVMGIGTTIAGEPQTAPTTGSVAVVKTARSPSITDISA